MSVSRARLAAVALLVAAGSAKAETAFERQNAALAACGRSSEQDAEKCAPAGHLVDHLKACILGELQIGASQELALRRQGYEACLAAAEAGLISAQTSVGEYQLSGLEEIVEPDFASARSWLEKAADAGHDKAQYDLARIHQSGLGAAAPDPALAFAWMTRVADAGLPAAIFDLGLMYLKGDGTPPDRDRARLLIAKSAELDHPPAQKRYAEILHAEALGEAGTIDAVAGERALYWACVTARRQPEEPGMAAMCNDLRSRLPADVTTRIMRAVRKRPRPAATR